MEIRIEDCPDAFCVILRGPKESEELQRTLRLLQGQMEDKLWVWGEDGVTTALSPAEIVWAEMVDGRRFIYTQDKIYRSAVGLGELESRWESYGLFRCAKPAVVNLNRIRSLRCCRAGRIEALMTTGGKVIVSRRCAPLLRDRIEEGSTG